MITVEDVQSTTSSSSFLLQPLQKIQYLDFIIASIKLITNLPSHAKLHMLDLKHALSCNSRACIRLCDPCSQLQTCRVKKSQQQHLYCGCSSATPPVLVINQSANPEGSACFAHISMQISNGNQPSCCWQESCEWLNLHKRGVRA